ncbi:MAG: cupin domain-containing protein [SAR202 cluster bacterium]|jgi:quercetin dioxygenase-like cupin family protein|nr:cupin domain-containing protein [SAR202 cluster bacterium]
MLVTRDKDVERRPIKLLEGLPVKGDVGVRSLMEGERMVLLEVHYPAGTASPVHAHSHESLCYILEGTARATVGDETFTVNAGDVCRHPEGVLHGIEAIEDTTVIEIKSPVQALSQFLGTGS